MASAALTGGEAATSPDTMVIHHTPMSERQQLALIKRLEKAASASSASRTTSNDSLLVSPPRAPLQVVTDVNGGNVGQPNSSCSSSSAESPLSNSGGNTPSLRRSMVASANSPTVDRLLKKISKKNTKGETPLHTAAIRGSSRLVRQLLVMGADPNAQDNAEWSPLHEACNRGNLAVVRVLKEFGANINLQGFDKDSPLHDAARNGHLKVVKFLVKSGADLGAKNVHGRTPREEVEVTRLRIAENEELEKTVSFLIEQEDKLDKKSPCSSWQISDASSEGEEESGDDEAENNDLAKFLGVTKSPVVQQALKTLGLTVASNAAASAASPSSTSSNGRQQQQQQRHRGNKRGLKSASSTPTSARRTSNHSSSTSVSPSACPSSKKIRLTYGEDGCQSGREDGGSKIEPVIKDEIACSETQESSSGLAKVNEELEEGLVVAECNNEPRKVPPLKIVLSSSKTKIIEDLSDVNKKAASDVAPAAALKQPDETSISISDSGINGARMTRSSKTTSEESEDHQQQQPQEEPQIERPPVRPMQPLPEAPTLSTEREYYMKKRKLRAPPVAVVLPQQHLVQPSSGEARGAEQQVTIFTPATDKSASSTAITANSEEESEEKKKELKKKIPPNDIEKFLNIRKQVEQRRKNLFPVYPKPPHGFKDYLMNRKTYLLQENAHERMNSIPQYQPPSSLKGPLRDLFIEQESERLKLRTKHIVEKEKLVLAVEQEILRVHGRAARALANQSEPYSVCTILKDEEVYNSVDCNYGDQSEAEKNKDVRSRYNGRLFLSWLQDVDDKWEKIKEQMVLRHHNEAESLNAVQKMDWEWKISEISGIPSSTEGIPQVDDLYIPMVRVSDDFALSNA